MTDTLPTTSSFNEEELAVLAGITSSAQTSTDPNPATDAGSEEKKEQDLGGYSKEELLVIYDSIVMKGEYVETDNLGARMSVTWSTRTVRESNMIAQMIDRLSLNTMLASQNLMRTLTMTYALRGFNGVDWSKSNLQERQVHFDKMPEPLMDVLSRSLAEFDKKVAKAVEVGRENF